MLSLALRERLESEGLLEEGGPLPWTSRAACSQLASRLLPGASKCGAVLLIFAAYSMRIGLPAVWEPWPYVPVLSPIYRQAEHWSIERARRLAVLVHVGCGVLMLIAIVMQLDAPTRRGWPWLHRCVGRIYCIAGVAALLALRWLRSAAGACSGRRGDPLMGSFIDASSAAWVCTTAVAIDAIVRRKDPESHSRAMLLSAAVAAVPILQRLLNALLLAPCAMVRASSHWMEPCAMRCSVRSPASRRFSLRCSEESIALHLSASRILPGSHALHRLAAPLRVAAGPALQLLLVRFRAVAKVRALGPTGRPSEPHLRRVAHDER